MNIHGVRIEESGLFPDVWDKECGVSKEDWDTVQEWRAKRWVIFPDEPYIQISILTNTGPVVVHVSEDTEQIIKKYKLYG